ncbi:unnamed protein product [Toxocara canis]|uniref:Uncharacterized protein n=1 Tax=Toxocara canis TaxID=6265 RepID=A0A3P7FD92_TOXCA|nr:unnamed protein product [Toxocara canis]
MFPDCIVKFYEVVEDTKKQAEENDAKRKVNDTQPQQYDDHESIV